MSSAEQLGGVKVRLGSQGKNRLLLPLAASAGAMVGFLIGIIVAYSFFVQKPSAETLKAYGPALAALATAVSAMVALVGTLWQNQRTISFQEHQFTQQRADARETFLIEKLHTTVQELSIAITSALHSICWLTWFAQNDPESLSEKETKVYNKEMHKILPRMLGIHAALASIDYDKAELLTKYIDEITELDVKVGSAILRLKGNSRTQALTELQSAYTKGWELTEMLRQKVHELIRPVSKPA